jgi:hypothetical protein
VPFNYSTARFSHSFNPESYDGTTGQVQIRPNNGQQLRAGFPLRSNLYLAKDHYLCYVTDDGVNEPSSWAVNEVSATIGICGPNACDWTEEWAAFAERSGLYVIWGGDPVKISQEISTRCLGNRAHRLGLDQLAVRTHHLGTHRPGEQADFSRRSHRWRDVAQHRLHAGLQVAEWRAGHGRRPDGHLFGFLRKDPRARQGAALVVVVDRGSEHVLGGTLDGTVQPFFGNGRSNGKVYQQYDCALQPSDDGNGCAVDVPDLCGAFARWMSRCSA